VKRLTFRAATTCASAPAAVIRPPSPSIEDGHWCWRGAAGTARFAFYGKTAGHADESHLDAAIARAGVELATVRQVHSARVVEAAPGPCGDADALTTRRAGLALRVVTADCVPVLLASSEAMAAVHAGWRGLAAGIVGAAARALAGTGPVLAIIGPAIGACCYEVGPEVADQVASRAASAAVIVDRGASRPHLDLALAARLELTRAGVAEIVTIDACTRCSPDRLWSYRRDGARAGRNVALIWREPRDPI
jgi:purine-nucleoside/S-methyl-5'-thioadenosine phosphorylase / adenosine deaminase